MSAKGSIAAQTIAALPFTSQHIHTYYETEIAKFAKIQDDINAAEQKVATYLGQKKDGGAAVEEKTEGKEEFVVVFWGDGGWGVFFGFLGGGFC